MHFSLISLAIPLLATIVEGSALLSPADQELVSSKRGIKWKNCNKYSGDELYNIRTIKCAHLKVPLDYSDPSSTKTIKIPLLKIPATKKGAKRTRSILVNFGGPGDDGTKGLEGLGARLQGIVGAEHDVIVWHPRGTHGNLFFSCDWKSPGPPDPLGNASDAADGQLWANSKIISDACHNKKQKKHGSLVGTVYTARDAMQIVDALQEDGHIRYWGFSYGTVLGATIAAMFPHRVDKMVLDGVVNARSYWHEFDGNSRESSDDVLRGFAKGCVQTPHFCPLAQHGSAGDVYDFIWRLIDNIKASPAVFTRPSKHGGDFELDYSTFKGYIYSSFYSP